MFEVEKTLVALGQKASDFLDSCKSSLGGLRDSAKARAQLNELEAVRGVDFHYKAADLMLRKIILRVNLGHTAQSVSEAVEVYYR
eukprot:gene29232-36246_t